MNHTQPRRTVRDRLVAFAKRELIPLAAVVLVLTSFRSAVADWYDVPTGSMRPTILEGDRILVNKLAYDLRIPFTNLRVASWSDPERGDIVVFPSPKDGTRLVKRIVGLPGDTVELRDNTLFINGVPAARHAIDPRTLRHVRPAERRGRDFFSEHLLGHGPHALTITPAAPAIRSFGPVPVPPHHYLALGDNRDQSADSRFFGFVPRASIVGRSGRIAISLDSARWYCPRWSRFGLAID